MIFFLSYKVLIEKENSQSILALIVHLKGK